MPNAKLTKQDIFKAAQSMVAKGTMPTQDKIREYLGSGSRGTIHKYLQQWKLSCYRNYKTEHAHTAIPEQVVIKLENEKQQLKATIAKLEAQNKVTALEFAKTEKKNIELAQKLAQIETQFEILEGQFNELAIEGKHTTESYQALKEERTTMLNKIEKDKDQLIDSLREELKLSHQASLEQIKTISYDGHDLLMQEKVKTLNLQEQIKPMAQEIIKLREELERANKINQPLKKEIDWLQRLMGEMLTSEQLQEYEKKKQLAEFARN